MKKFLIFLPVIFLFFLVLNSQRSVIGSPGYADPETCKACHEDKYNSYVKGIHGIKADPRTPASKLGCDSCHGPGAAHVKAGGGKGVGGILPLGPKSPLPAEKRNEVCLECHLKGRVAMWHGGSHESRGVSCADCHSIHAGYQKDLAKHNETEVCIQCHKQIKAQLQRLSRHPIREGKMSCSDCHNSHGTVADKLVSANSINEKCYECHAEKRGPFLWEHAPVTEDCLTCHTPHGSSRDKLLVAKQPWVCQSCHSNVTHPGVLRALTPAEAGLSIYRFAISRAIGNKACLNCHPQIHGSNHPSGKSLTR